MFCKFSFTFKKVCVNFLELCFKHLKTFQRAQPTSSYFLQRLSSLHSCFLLLLAFHYYLQVSYPFAKVKAPCIQIISSSNFLHFLHYLRLLEMVHVILFYNCLCKFWIPFHKFLNLLIFRYLYWTMVATVFEFHQFPELNSSMVLFSKYKIFLMKAVKAFFWKLRRMSCKKLYNLLKAIIPSYQILLKGLTQFVFFALFKFVTETNAMFFRFLLYAIFVFQIKHV